MFSQNRIQFNQDTHLANILYTDNEYLQDWSFSGMERFPFCFGGFSLSYCYEFPSQNKVSWLAGGEIGYNRYGVNLDIQGGCLFSLLQKEHLLMDLQFLTKVGAYLSGPYNQISLDLVLAHKENKCVFYGGGIQNTISASLARTTEGAKNNKVLIQPGIQLFVGYKF